MPAGSLSSTFSARPGLVHAGLQPADLREIDAVVLGEDAAHVDAGGLRPFRDADGAAFEVLRGLDAAIAAHVDRRMAVNARRKHRDRHHRRRALRGERGVFPERQLGDVPFQIPGEAEGDLLDRRKDQRRERDAVGAHDPLGDLAHVLVVADRERELHRGRAAAGDDGRRPQLRRGSARGLLLGYLSSRFVGGHGALPVVGRVLLLGGSRRRNDLAGVPSRCTRQMLARRRRRRGDL